MRRTAFMALCLMVLTAASLPVQGPVPETRPETKPVTDAQKPAASDEKTDAEPDDKPKDKEQKKEEPAVAVPGEEKPADTLENKVLPIEPEDAGEHQACLAELGKIGAAFKPADRIDDDHGCGIDKPIVLSKILPDVAVKPEGTMRCETALALARWVRDSVIPAASVAVPENGPLTTINQASGYVCRLRNNAETGKISEHARGNAVDVASFRFAKGEAIEIKPRKEDATLSGAFQRTVTASACLYFSTVLDPESDAAHENHLHLDVLKRKGGYRYCH